MYYSKAFIDVVSFAEKTGSYIGSGNPNSKILLVGKEVATEIDESKDKILEEQNFNNYQGNVQDWVSNCNKNIKQSNVCDWIYNDPEKINNPLFAFKGAEIKEEGKTWRKYQKLHDFIFGSQIGSNIGKFGHNFQERFFITEMSDAPSKRTKDAQSKSEFKQKLEVRKNGFFRSAYIQSFPVIILACSNYISGNEIEDIFKVKFKEQKGEGKQLFWTHYGTDKPQLVIHTRQLSTNVSNDLLHEIAEEIKIFINVYDKNSNPAHNIL